MLNIREIADRIKNLRELLNLTPEEMADVINAEYRRI